MDIEAEVHDLKAKGISFETYDMPGVTWDGEIVEADQSLLLNTATFYEDLIRVSVVSPEMDETDWEDLFAVITNAQYGELSMGAWLLNRGEVDIPFSLAASRMRRATEGE